MFTEKQIDRVLGKLKHLEKRLETQLFEQTDEIEMSSFVTDGRYHTIPEQENFVPCRKGTVFEGEGIYVWMKGTYRVPEELDNRTLFIRPRVQAYEGMLWVNGIPYGNFASKYVINTHGNHYCDLLKQKVKAGEIIDVAIEFYSHHFVIGTQPFAEDCQTDFKIVYDGMDICLKREELCDFYFSLKIVNQMAEALEEQSFRRAEVIRALLDVHTLLCYDFESAGWEEFMEGARKANQILQKLLASHNAQSAPFAGLIGHSHMDTAWLWNRRETEKKCARTYANQMNLMDQYPDYTFIQSSAYHSDIIKRMYPDLFEQIKKRVAEGRYEPNGGVWIECDCNIPGGEYLIRQFLWGQRFTRENFGYTSDAFWLPDTFGYSASLPQIMRGCGIRYFLTTKIAWNDTNQFPYNTFYWKGIDGSDVLVHFNRTHVWPDPMTLKENILDKSGNTILEKEVSDMRLISYGYGDGGGGPEFEMIEMANRIADVEGIPRSAHTTVSNFMQTMESGLYHPSVYCGELYLELHRGTLTNQHVIKRNNRKAERSLHDLEYLCVRRALRKGEKASADKTRSLVNSLLINQFHDILPGTCIPSAHDDAIREMGEVLDKAKKETNLILEDIVSQEENAVTLVNPLSFERMDTVYLPFEGRYIAEAYPQQLVETLEGENCLAIAGIKVDGYSSLVLHMTMQMPETSSAFREIEDGLETPFYEVHFNKKGFIESLTDKRNGRQIRGKGYALNTFLLAEDVPMDWDNWDIDADCEWKLQDTSQLLSRTCVADGAVEYRIRSTYQLTKKSTLTQDMIFYAHRPEIVFETKMNWQDNHRLLKTAFDTNIHTDFTSQEIQFGYIRRNTNRNTSAEKAKFEVPNHKYTDLSESRYGVALLNDCKYGISVEGGSMRLSLHKGGCRPDYRGDKGIHSCTYVLLPHEGSLGVRNVVQPAYFLNDPIILSKGILELEPLLHVEADNIIVETVKPAEEEGHCFVVRMYEAEGTRTNTGISFGEDTTQVAETNMLEEVQNVYDNPRKISVEFRPFEIKTFLVSYK